MSSKGTGFSGRAYVNTICTPTSLGIIRYRKVYETIKLIAHELGHSWVSPIFIHNFLIWKLREVSQLEWIYIYLTLKINSVSQKPEYESRWWKQQLQNKRWIHHVTCRESISKGRPRQFFLVFKMFTWIIKPHYSKYGLWNVSEETISCKRQIDWLWELWNINCFINGCNSNSRNVSSSKPILHCRKRTCEGALFNWLTKNASDAKHKALYK